MLECRGDPDALFRVGVDIVRVPVVVATEVVFDPVFPVDEEIMVRVVVCRPF